MKKIIGLTIAAVLIIGMVGGGTWAYFSDTETSDGNTFTAGTLDLNLDGGNANVVKFTVSDVKPEDTGFGKWQVSNVGSIDGYLDLESISYDGAVGTTTDSELDDETGESDTPQLSNYLMVHIFVDDNNDGTWQTGETDIVGSNATPIAISAMASSYDANVSLVATTGAETITLAWSVPATTDNRIQGDSVTLNMTFELQQRSAE